MEINEDFDENDIKNYLELTPHDYHKWCLLKEDKKLSRVVIGHLEEAMSDDYFDYNKKLIDNSLERVAVSFNKIEKELSQIRKTEPDVKVEDTHLDYNISYFEQTRSESEFDLFVNELNRKFNKEGFKNNEAAIDYLKTVNFPVINNSHYIFTHRTDDHVSSEKKVTKILLEKDYIKYYNEMQEIQTKFYKSSPFFIWPPKYLNGRKYKQEG